MKRLLTLVLFAVLAAGAAFGQGQDVVSVKVVPPPAPLNAGQAAPFSLELTIRSPYHINAEQPLEDFLSRRPKCGSSTSRPIPWPSTRARWS
jgi:hypothetical protein